MRLTTTTTPLESTTTRLASRASIIEAAEVAGYRTMFCLFCGPSTRRSRGIGASP